MNLQQSHDRYDAMVLAVQKGKALANLIHLAESQELALSNAERSLISLIFFELFEELDTLISQCSSPPAKY